MHESNFFEVDVVLKHAVLCPRSCSNGQALIPCLDKQTGNMKQLCFMKTLFFFLNSSFKHGQLTQTEKKRTGLHYLENIFSHFHLVAFSHADMVVLVLFVLVLKFLLPTQYSRSERNSVSDAYSAESYTRKLNSSVCFLVILKKSQVFL